jgi:hypothetical protein
MRGCTPPRVVDEAFAEEKPQLRTLPLAPFRSVLKLERRVSHEGMVSVGGNLYSVPDATRKRVVEVHTLANEVRIFEERIPCWRATISAGSPRVIGSSENAANQYWVEAWPPAASADNRYRKTLAAPHAFAPNPSDPRESEMHPIYQVFRTVQLRPLAALRSVLWVCAFNAARMPRPDVFVM